MANWDPEDDPMFQLAYRPKRKSRWTWQGVITVLLLLAMMTLLVYDWGEAWLR